MICQETSSYQSYQELNVAFILQCMVLMYTCFENSKGKNFVDSTKSQKSFPRSLELCCVEGLMRIRKQYLRVLRWFIIYLELQSVGSMCHSVSKVAFKNNSASLCFLYHISVSLHVFFPVFPTRLKQHQPGNCKHRKWRKHGNNENYCTFTSKKVSVVN